MAQQSPDQATLVFRIESLERLFHDLQQQLQQYVRSSENNLHLQSIRDTCERIERELGLAKQQLTDLNAKLTLSEAESQKRDAAQREEQDKLQITTLRYIVGIIISGLLLLLGAYFTHLIK